MIHVMAGERSLKMHTHTAAACAVVSRGSRVEEGGGGFGGP